MSIPAWAWLKCIRCHSLTRSDWSVRCIACGSETEPTDENKPKDTARETAERKT